jgi:hypothetical protein
MRKTTLRLALFGTLAASLASPALATDGVILINHAKAVAGSVTPGDAAGFPVSITVSGSYRLTSDLDISLAASPSSTTAILVTAPWVTIDLNGFAIRGNNDCTYTQGAGVSCTLANGGGDGINASGQTGLTVKNGSIRGMADLGILGSTGARIDGVALWDNGSTCVLVSSYSYVNDVSATNCGGDGVFFHAGSIITNSILRGNDNDGVECNTGSCLMRGNSSAFNDQHGFHGNFADGYLVHDNAIHLSEGEGIRMGAGANVYDNAIGAAGGSGIIVRAASQVRGNSVEVAGGSGISVVTSGLVVDNSVRVATSYGIEFQSTGAYGQNTLYSNNAGGAQVLNGIEVKTNLCQSDTTCP